MTIEDEAFWNWFSALYRPEAVELLSFLNREVTDTAVENLLRKWFHAFGNKDQYEKATSNSV